MFHKITGFYETSHVICLRPAGLDLGAVETYFQLQLPSHEPANSSFLCFGHLMKRHDAPSVSLLLCHGTVTMTGKPLPSYPPMSLHELVHSLNMLHGRRM